MRPTHNVCTFLAAIVISAYATLAFTMPAHASDATCIMNVLSDTQKALGSTSRLKRVYNTYFGEALAAQAAGGRKWKKFSVSERKAQVDFARDFVVTIASNLEPYAGVKVTLTSHIGNKVIAIAATTDGPEKITAYMSGPCSFSDLQAGGKSLARLIGSYTDHIANN